MTGIFVGAYLVVIKIKATIDYVRGAEEGKQVLRDLLDDLLIHIETRYSPMPFMKRTIRKLDVFSPTVQKITAWWSKEKEQECEGVKEKTTKGQKKRWVAWWWKVQEKEQEREEEEKKTKGGEEREIRGEEKKTKREIKGEEKKTKGGEEREIKGGTSAK